MDSGKNIDFLKSVEIFGETMSERFGGANNSFIIIASDGKQSLQVNKGNDDELLDALTTVFYMCPGIADLVYRALGLILMANVNHTEINGYNHDAE